MEVREIAAASTGNEYLFACAIGAFQDGDAPSAFAGLDRAHHPGGARAQNYRIEFVDHDREVSTAGTAASDYRIFSLSLDGSSICQPCPRIPNICYNADRFCRLDFPIVVGDSKR